MYLSSKREQNGNQEKRRNQSKEEEMIIYKITLENGESQTTRTGKELYCSILDKFNIKYTIEEINDNDIPHSDIRRMESEGVYEEKFGEPNFSNEDMDDIAELGYD